jgi:hypothetical protein
MGEPRAITRRRGGLLRQRNFRLFWTGESISEVGNSVTIVVIPLVAIDTLHTSTFGVRERPGRRLVRGADRGATHRGHADRRRGDSVLQQRLSGCRLPRSWDHRQGFSATSMGPPGCQ